jgi:hypothetical protein
MGGEWCNTPPFTPFMLLGVLHGAPCPQSPCACLLTWLFALALMRPQNSNWGNDFRPDYRKLGALKRQFPEASEPMLWPLHPLGPLPCACIYTHDHSCPHMPPHGLTQPR